MSPFLIFAAVLTVIYLVYFALMIARDMYSSPTQKRSSVEIFNVSDMIMEEESEVVVEENYTPLPSDETENPPVVYIGNPSPDEENEPASSDILSSVSETFPEGEPVETEDDFSLDSDSYGNYLLEKNKEQNKREILRESVNEI